MLKLSEWRHMFLCASAKNTFYNVLSARLLSTLASYHISNTDCTRCLYIFWFTVPSTFFYIGGPHPPEHGYQWVNDACQLNLFTLPVCHQRHGELKLLHFFSRMTTTSLLTLSLRFQRHRCSPELDECQMGRRRRCCGRFVFGKCAVSQESYPLGIKASMAGQGFHQCWLPFVSRVVSLATHRTSAVGDGWIANVFWIGPQFTPKCDESFMDPDVSRTFMSRIVSPAFLRASIYSSRIPIPCISLLR